MWRIRHECLFIIVIQSSTQGGRRCKLITVVSWNDLSSHLKSTVSSRPKRYFNPTLAWWWGETTDVINLSAEWETTTGRDSRRSGEEKGIGQVIRLLIFSCRCIITPWTSQSKSYLMSFSFSFERLSGARNVLPRCGMIVHRNCNPCVAALTCTKNTKQDSSKIAQGSGLYLLLLLL